MSVSTLRLAIVLGLLSAVGPFAIDMYLPALPEIGANIGASTSAMQGTITGYFLAFGIAQLFYGPWADQAGRKPPIYLGLLIFLAGSLICTFATGIEMLIFGRCIQGLGGAAVMVVPRAVIRDLHTGHQATRMMASIMLVISISPFLAPLAGAGLMHVFGWRAIFATLSGAAVISLLITSLLLPETLPKESRQPVSLPALLNGVGMLLRHRGFLSLTLLGAFGIASFFVFIAQASFVYSQSFGLTPTQFSLAFALNAVGFFSSSQFAAKLGQKFGSVRVMAAATSGFALSTLVLFGLGLGGFAVLPVVMAGLFCGNACLGLVIPTAMVMALEEHGRVAGLASSLGGTMQMVVGGLMVAVSAPIFDGTALPMLGTIAACGLLSFLFSRLALRYGPKREA